MTRPKSARSRSTGPSLGERLRAWRDLHLYSLFSSIGRMAQRPWATMLTVGVMAVALVLPLCLALLVGNLERVSGDFRESREVSLFLTTATDMPAAQELAASLRRQPDIASVVLRSPEEGLAEFRDMADFTEALAVLDENPLPAVLVVAPAEGVEPDTLTARLGALPQVDFVQHDAQWRSRLSAWLEFGRRLVWVAAALLGVGVLLTVGNTVRLDIEARSEEIRTVQLLGASDGFVRRPFLYLGAWYGLFAAILALVLAAFATGVLRQSVTSLVDNYGSSFQLQGLDVRWVLMTVIASIMLGWLGAWLATGHHLRHSLPEAEAQG
ncbi:MAG: permease-like cell division protein FtsX [Xanthomonadales bacterium]|nr:permease-like cell division protein FtsX [Xanthomonadales bacterium]